MSDKFSIDIEPALRQPPDARVVSYALESLLDGDSIEDVSKEVAILGLQDFPLGTSIEAKRISAEILMMQALRAKWTIEEFRKGE